MKIVEYYVFAGEMIDLLEEVINSKIKEGWQPFGNIFHDNGHSRYWYQPMVKYEE